MMGPAVAAMRSLPGNRWEFDLLLSPDHPAFKGHFPGVPVLPGVVQLDWAVRLADAHLGIDLGAAQNFQVKYQKVIQPTPRGATLALTWDRPRAALHFVYTVAGATASSGRITLPARP